MECLPSTALSASSLIALIYKNFLKIPDPRTTQTKVNISLTDHLMSGLAVFGLKFPSLLQYDRERQDLATELNLKNLYHVKTPPCDTYLRERLDELDPGYLRPAFTQLFTALVRRQSP